jgi:anaerobic magnesium-protoporphyrin IX monomethyl ester cyclase
MTFIRDGESHFMRTYASGPAILKAQLERHFFEVDYKDLCLSSNGPESLSVFAAVDSLDLASKVVAIGCMNNLLHFALLMADEIKRRRPDCKIVLGGPGPSGVGRAIISSFRQIDVVISGEAENSLPTVVSQLFSEGDLSGIPGVGWRKDSEVLGTIATPDFLDKDLDALPWPDYGGTNVERYENIGVMTARGCPYQCTFCDSPGFWGHRYRKRSIQGVRAEMAHLHDSFGIPHIYIWDDTFLVDRRRVEAFCEALLSLGPPIAWSAYARVDQVDWSLLTLMRASGCTSLFFGIESGSDGILDVMKKGFKIGFALRQLELAREIIPNVMTGFIWGFPEETMDDLQRTEDVIEMLAYRKIQSRCVPLNPCANTSLYGLHSNNLVFDCDFQPYLVPFVESSTRSAAIDLISHHPSVFPSFWTIPSTLFSKKLEHVKHLHRGRPGTYLLSTY